MRKECIITLLFSLLLFSCNSKNDYQAINKNKPLKDLTFQDVFVKQNNVELASDTEHYIENIEDMIVTDDSYIIIDRRNNQFLKFTKDGKIKKAIGNYGKGPGEYLSLHSIDLSKNILYLLDGRGWKVIKYTLGGKFIEEFKLQFMSAYVVANPKNEFFTYEPNLGIKAHKANLVKHYNFEGKLIKSFCETFFEFGLADGFMFKDYENNIYVVQSMTSKVFKYTKDGEYIKSIGKPTKYFREFVLENDKVLPKIEKVRKSTYIMGVTATKKYVILQFRNLLGDTGVGFDPNNFFTWVDIYTQEGDLVVEGMKVDKTLVLKGVDRKDNVYFMKKYPDKIDSEPRPLQIVSYKISDLKYVK